MFGHGEAWENGGVSHGVDEDHNYSESAWLKISFKDSSGCPFNSRLSAMQPKVGGPGRNPRGLNSFHRTHNQPTPTICPEDLIMVPKRGAETIDVMQDKRCSNCDRDSTYFTSAGLDTWKQDVINHRLQHVVEATLWHQSSRVGLRTSWGREPSVRQPYPYQGRDPARDHWKVHLFCRTRNSQKMQTKGARDRDTIDMLRAYPGQANFKNYFGWERGKQVYHVQQQHFRASTLDSKEDFTISLSDVKPTWTSDRDTIDVLKQAMSRTSNRPFEHAEDHTEEDIHQNTSVATQRTRPNIRRRRTRPRPSSRTLAPACYPRCLKVDDPVVELKHMWLLHYKETLLSRHFMSSRSDLRGGALWVECRNPQRPSERHTAALRQRWQQPWKNLTPLLTKRTENGEPTALEIRVVTPEEEEPEITIHKCDDQRCMIWIERQIVSEQ